jgi:hypothetical protein
MEKRKKKQEKTRTSWTHKNQVQLDVQKSTPSKYGTVRSLHTTTIRMNDTATPRPPSKDLTRATACFERAGSGKSRVCGLFF